MQTDTIRECLQAEPDKWEGLAVQSCGMEEIKDQQLSTEQVAAFYEKETSGLDNKVSLKDLFLLSREMSDEVLDYRHSEHQAALAAIALSQSKQFVIVVSPTGSGKTWVQGMIAKYLCRQGKKVTVVEPNVLLRMQTAEKLAVVDYAITITSIDLLYQEGPWNEVIILNEYDLIVNDSPYKV